MLLGPNSCLYQHLFIIQSILLDKIMFYYICFEHSFCFKWFSTTLIYKTKFKRVCELVVSRWRKCHPYWQPPTRQYTWSVKFRRNKGTATTVLGPFQLKFKEVCSSSARLSIVHSLHLGTGGRSRSTAPQPNYPTQPTQLSNEL